MEKIYKYSSCGHPMPTNRLIISVFPLVVKNKTMLLENLIHPIVASNTIVC